MTDHGLEEEKNTRGRNVSMRVFCILGSNYFLKKLLLVSSEKYNKTFYESMRE